VEKAVAGKHGWQSFTREAQVAGVIDADYKPVDDIARLAKLNVFMLPVHEAESVLCHPEAVESLSRAMHPPHKQVGKAQVVDALSSRLTNRRIAISSRRNSRASTKPSQNVTLMECYDSFPERSSPSRSARC
jgi:hypothetical protein